MKNQISKQLAYLTFTLTLIITIVAIFIPKIVDAAPNYKWGDKNHDSLTGPTGTKYSSLGYACLIIFKNDGTLDESRGAYPESSDKDIQVSYSNEAFSGVSTVPSCKDGNPANYVWISSDKRSAVVVGGNQDNKLVGIGSPYKGEARLWQIGPNGVPEKPVDIAKIDKPNDNSPPETDQTKKGVETEQASTGGDKSTEEQCSQALSPFGWILCPATNFADNLYSLFKQLVNNLLFFESDKYNDNGLYDSWRIMVTLANTVLVLVAIVMIAAQIFNFEFISAYTVKKALPRIVVAAILIQLSWFMVTTGVQLVNAIGSGIYWLLVAPFTRNIDPGGSSGVLEIGPILAQGGANGSEAANAGMFVVVSGALAAGALVAFATGLWVTMIVAAVGVVISILVAIITLILREAMLIVLIALAPLAIAFWILPGTNGLWSMWWKTFSRLLLMYPLIMMLFAGGTITAILLASAGDNINKIFAIVAYFIPVFLISATYKFAGGAFASMANFTSKLGGSLKSGADKVGGEGRKSFRGWQASKYDPSSTGFKGKFQNTGARLAAGGLPIGTKSQMRTASAQASYLKEKSEQADFLIGSKYDSIKGVGNTPDERAADQWKKQEQFLLSEAKKGGDDGKAAMRMILSTKRTDLLNNLVSSPEGLEAFRDYQASSSGFSASVAQAGRADLLDSSDKKVMTSGAKEALGFDKSFWDDKNASRRNKLGAGRPGGRAQTLRELGEYENWNRLDEAGKKHVAEELSRIEPAWRPPRSANDIPGNPQNQQGANPTTQTNTVQPTQPIGPINVPGNPQGPSSPWSPPGPQRPPSGPSTPP